MTRPGHFVRGLARSRRTVALYGFEHPVARETLEEVFKEITELLAGRAFLRLFIHDDTFYLGKTVLLEESLRLPHLLLDLKDREIGAIEMHEGLESWELHRLIEVLNMRPSEIHRVGGPKAFLDEKGVRHVVVGAARALAPEEQEGLRADPRDVYRAGLRVADDLYFQASRDLALDVKKATQVVNSLIDVMTQDRSALLGVAILQNYDEETAHHSVNVSILSLMLGVQMQLERPLLLTLGLAGLLHDIGKVRIPHEILAKAGSLTADEEDVVGRHTLYGAHLLRNIVGLNRLAMVVAFEHHANYDLSGYPKITAKQTPHPLTRLVQVADFYDASTSSGRDHAQPLLPSEAVRLVQAGAGSVFDPAAARIFVQMVGRYPVGSVVELDTGEIAVVTRPGERDVERPVLKMLTNDSKEVVTSYALSLEETPDRRIVRTIHHADAPVDVTALSVTPSAQF